MVQGRAGGRREERRRERRTGDEPLPRSRLPQVLLPRLEPLPSSSRSRSRRTAPRPARNDEADGLPHAALAPLAHDGALVDALLGREEGQVERVGLGLGIGAVRVRVGGERGAELGGGEERRVDAGGGGGGPAAEEVDRVDRLGLCPRAGPRHAPERGAVGAGHGGEAAEGEVGLGVVSQVRGRGGDEVRRGGVGERAELWVRVAWEEVSQSVDEAVRDARRGGERPGRGWRAT